MNDEFHYAGGVAGRRDAPRLEGARAAPATRCSALHRPGPPRPAPLAPMADGPAARARCSPLTSATEAPRPPTTGNGRTAAAFRPEQARRSRGKPSLARVCPALPGPARPSLA